MTKLPLFEGYFPLLLPSLDPLRINKMNLIQGGDNKVNIALYFNDIDFMGLSKAKVYKVAGFNEPSKLDFIEIRFVTPAFTLVGPYKSSGRILLLPINGHGITNIMLGKRI